MKRGIVSEAPRPMTDLWKANPASPCPTKLQIVLFICVQTGLRLNIMVYHKMQFAIFIFTLNGFKIS